MKFHTFLNVFRHGYTHTPQINTQKKTHIQLEFGPSLLLNEKINKILLFAFLCSCGYFSSSRSYSVPLPAPSFLFHFPFGSQLIFINFNSCSIHLRMNRFLLYGCALLKSKLYYTSLCIKSHQSVCELHRICSWNW